MIPWAIELSQFDIKYKLRIAIKAQGLADFIVEFTLPDEDNLTNETGRYRPMVRQPKGGGSRGRHNHP